MEQAPIVIEAPAPIPIPLLKRKFTENIHFVIDYTNSRVKGNVFLTYLSNAAVDCTIKFTTLQERLDVIHDYMHLPGMANVPQLEDDVMHLLLAATGAPHGLPFDPMEFITNNEPIFQKWMRNLCMVPAYAFHSYAAYKPLLDNVEEVPGEDLEGINFVNLIKHPLFAILMKDIPEEHWCWNKMFFEEYCFGGKNLFTFFESTNNPYYVALMAMTVSDSQPELNALREEFIGVHVDTIFKGMSHVPSA